MLVTPLHVRDKRINFLRAGLWYRPIFWYGFSAPISGRPTCVIGNGIMLEHFVSYGRSKITRMKERLYVISIIYLTPRWQPIRLAVWLSGNALASINVVALRQTRLVLLLVRVLVPVCQRTVELEDVKTFITNRQSVTEHHARRRHIASKPEERTSISNMGGLYSTDAAATINLLPLTTAPLKVNTSRRCLQ